MTNGFIKKKRKTPKAEIELAQKYKADYEFRMMRVENGTCSPAIATLQLLAKGMGKQLFVSFR